MILITPLFLKIFTRGFAKAMAIYPFILIKHHELKEDATLINHEKIHFAQQKEMLIIFFYLLYISEYFYHRCSGKNHSEAYHSIRFEREAYKNESNLNYLDKRKHFNWLNV